MRISDLILALVEVSNKHGDIAVSGHLSDDFVRKLTVIDADSAEVAQSGRVATEVFLE